MGIVWVGVLFGAWRQLRGTNIYISNLPDFITKEGLQDLFSVHGTVLSCRVARKQGQCPIGFVQYTEPGLRFPLNGFLLGKNMLD